MLFFSKMRRGQIVLETPVIMNGNIPEYQLQQPNIHTLEFENHKCFIPDDREKTIEMALSHPQYGAGKLFWAVSEEARIPAGTEYHSGPSTTANKPVPADKSGELPPEKPVKKGSKKADSGNPALQVIEDPASWNHVKLVKYVTPVIEIQYPKQMKDDKLKELVVGLGLDIKDTFDEYNNEELAKIFNECVKRLT